MAVPRFAFLGHTAPKTARANWQNAKRSRAARATTPVPQPTRSRAVQAAQAMTAFIAPTDDDEPTASTPAAAANSFLDTTDPERVEYLYSIPDETEKLDEDFADEWATAVTKSAATKGWLVLDADELAKALASDEYGAPPGLMRCLEARFRPAASITRAAETARRRRQGRPVAAVVSYLQAWSVAARGVYVVADAALDAALSSFVDYVSSLRGAERCFALRSTHVDDELRVDAAPASLAAACARAALATKPPASLALARCARCVRTRRALLCRGVVTGAISVDDAADLERLEEGTVRIHGAVTPSDAAAVALRAALLRSALALKRAEAREASALQACRGAKTVFNARRWKLLRDDVRKRRTIHAQHLEAPHDALCGLWDDGETVQAMTLAADALKQARLDGVSVEDVAAASEALQTESSEVAAVDDALREAFVSPEDADLERELEALLDPPAPELPDFPSVPVEELSLAGLSLAEPPAPASPVAPARTPVPA